MPLPVAYFRRPTLEVARDLIGARLVHECPGGPRLEGQVVETEGYTEDDPAFHGWGLLDETTGRLKKEGRGIELFGRPGTAYVYLIYGMYWLLNVVTEPEGTGGAVLIRAVEPNLEVPGARAFMEERRAAARKDADLTNGPGKLTQAFDIGEQYHEEPLTRKPLYFEASDENHDFAIATSSRIGITRGVERRWRFFVEGHPFVSVGTPSDQR